MQDYRLLQQYEDLKTEDNLLGLIKDKVREGLYFEYKRKSDPKSPNLEETDKKNFSRALSSFANSEGGILVWGIATKDKGDSKLPVKLKPIKQVYEFEKRLNNYLASAVQPPIENLLCDVIYRKGSKSYGYIKYYIQPSDLTPHRSSSADASYDHYYARNSEGCYIMPHYQVSDMFGRRQKPVLSLRFSSSIGEVVLNSEDVDPDGYNPRVDFELSILNKGRAIGRDIMLMLFGPEQSEMKLILDVPNAEVHSLSDKYSGKQVYQINSLGLFYPTINTFIGKISIQLHKDHISSDKALVKWKILADNMAVQNGEFSFLKTDSMKDRVKI